MGMSPLILLSFFCAILVATSQGSDVVHRIQPLQIHPLRLQSDSACLSWRVGVEAHNIIDWVFVPEECDAYIGNYISGGQYRKDSKVVADEAYEYAKSLKIRDIGKDLWVFDIDETVLSNLPFFTLHGFGAEPLNFTESYEWVGKGEAPALPESLKLYNNLLSLGIKVAFLTGRGEGVRNITATNLKNVGYHTWEKLLLRGSAFENATTVAYKSAQRRKLVKEGYRIVGNAGDQWSDITGTNVGERTFKFPNPMYYVK